MQCAEVYKREGQMLLHASSQTVDGLWIGSPSMLCLDATSEAFDLGSAARRVLAASTLGIPHPDRSQFSEIAKELLAAFGVSSWAAFARATTACSLELEENVIRIIPTRNNHRDGGFDHLREYSFEIPSDASCVELGDAILRAFKKCEE